LVPGASSVRLMGPAFAIFFFLQLGSQSGKLGNKKNRLSNLATPFRSHLFFPLRFGIHVKCLPAGDDVGLFLVCPVLVRLVELVSLRTGSLLF